MKRLKYHLALIIILLGVLSFNLPLQGEKTANSSQKLSITEIMKGEEFVGTSPSFIFVGKILRKRISLFIVYLR